MFNIKKIKQLTDVINKANNKIQEYETKMHTLNKELETSKLHNIKYQNEMQTLHEKNDILENEIIKLEETIKFYKLGKESLKGDFENQTANIEETTATVEEINASMQQIKEQVMQSSINNQKNVEIIENFSNTIHSLNENIDKLADGRDQVNDISNTINNIAQQTNLLALNASIESAHAGEYGKGFSIIASEVRKLSEDVKRRNVDIVEILKFVEATIITVKNQMITIIEKTKNLKDDTINRAEHVQTINATIEEIAHGTEQISVVMQNQAEESQKILEILENNNVGQ